MHALPRYGMRLSGFVCWEDARWFRFDLFILHPSTRSPHWKHNQVAPICLVNKWTAASTRHCVLIVHCRVKSFICSRPFGSTLASLGWKGLPKIANTILFGNCWSTEGTCGWPKASSLSTHLTRQLWQLWWFASRECYCICRWFGECVFTADGTYYWRYWQEVCFVWKQRWFGVYFKTWVQWHNSPGD